MTCTGCLHQDYCIFFGCPFKREPQANFREFPDGTCTPTLEQVAGTCGRKPEKFPSGVGPGNHQPRSRTCGLASQRQPASGRARDRAICPAGSRNSFIALLATKDGAEPSIARSSDAGAVPAASTMSPFPAQGPSKPADGWPPHRLRQVSESRSGLLMGANQDRRRSDDRSCTRAWSTSQAENHNCERQSVRCRTAPRGVSEAAPAGRVATEARHSFNSNGGRTRLRPVSTERACESTACPASRGGKRAVQSIRISRGMDKAPDQRPSRGGIKRLAAQLWWLCDMRWQWPGPREINSQFGCSHTGPNLNRSEGQSAITDSGPSVSFWIARGGVTAAMNSRVTA